MPTSGTLNVVCHGTIVFVVGQDGSIDLWMPKVDRAWNHRWQAGAWAGQALDSMVPGKQYALSGVRSGDGQQRFDPALNVCVEGSGPSPAGPREYRRVRLPPPKRISPANVVPISPQEAFTNPADQRVAGLRQLALLQVLSYDCDDLSSVRLLAGAGGAPLSWAPQIVDGGAGPAVNLHIFAEPWTFKPDPPPATAPFNVLAASVPAARQLTMNVPPHGESSFIDIDPWDPVPGLPENEKLVLSQHAHFQKAGALSNQDRPFNCGSLVVQPPPPAGTTTTTARTARAPGRAFAILRNKDPKVLANPRVFLIFWGSRQIDSGAEAKVKQILGLPCITSALAEYGVNPAEFQGSYAYPEGSTTKVRDARLFPATTKDSALAHGLAGLIGAGAIPDPRRVPGLLYLIVPPPGAVSAAARVMGSHNYFYLDPLNKQAPVYYAWALRPSMDQWTWTLSHELLDACTDPEPPLGYVFQGPEICDIAKGLHSTAGGIAVTGYFSHKDGAFKPAGASAARVGG